MGPLLLLGPPAGVRLETLHVDDEPRLLLTDHAVLEGECDLAIDVDTTWQGLKARLLAEFADRSVKLRLARLSSAAGREPEGPRLRPCRVDALDEKYRALPVTHQQT